MCMFFIVFMIIFSDELNQPGSIQELIAALLPEAFAPEAVYTPLDLAYHFALEHSL